MISLEEAYRRWGDDLVAFATTVTRREDAADAVADVFERLLADPERWATVRDPRRYLLRSVANAGRANGRSVGRRHAREAVVWAGGPAVAELDTTSDAALAVVVDRRIATVVEELSPQQRSVLFLTYWLDEPVVRVAEILDVTPGTVRRQLARARRRLRGTMT